MGSRKRSKSSKFDSDSYDDDFDYDDFDYEDDLGSDDLRKVSKDFYSTDWEDPSGPESRFSSRRKIERRNDLKRLYSQFDEYDELDLGNDW